MSSIAEVFERCRQEKRAAFIPYLTAGDPDLATTPALLKALVAAGADIIELGVPFSDPIADGPTNQRAAFRALASGTTLSGILQMISRHREELGVPLVLFTYFNPIHARGAARFAEQAALSGVDGVLVVDLPPEEGEAELFPALRERGVCSIQLLAPTSTPERIRQASEAGSGFLYYVSRTGVTGTRESLALGLRKQIKKIRRKVSLPLAVGFGISTSEQAAEVARVADGVVVGSALVGVIEEVGPDSDLPGTLEARAWELARALKRRGRLGGD